MSELPSLPTSIDVAHRLLVWLDERVAGFPSAARVALGRRTLDASVDLLGVLTAAHYAPRGSPVRAAHLDEANARLALLRLLVRACHERRYLATGQRDHAARLLADVGRTVGAWRKHERAIRTAREGAGP